MSNLTIEGEKVFIDFRFMYVYIREHGSIIRIATVVLESVDFIGQNFRVYLYMYM